MIFQDPATALNPVFTIGQQLMAVMRYHHVVPTKDMRVRALSLLSEVGLPDPRRVISQYPHELSGGMQQRAVIAIALSCNAELIIADEPTTSLDVTIQAQILDLLLKIREERNLTVILITHDMAVVRRACQDIAVLYAGRIVEEGPVDVFLTAPQHPYTIGLLAALPEASVRRGSLRVIPGMLPSSGEELHGCVFAARCGYTMPVCLASSPNKVVIDGTHSAACWLPGAVYAPESK